MVGPNHQDGCDGSNFRYSGEGYNRVKVCKCGAEDHCPDSESLQGLFNLCKKIVEEEDAQLATTGRVQALADELHAGRDYTDHEMDYFELVEDILIEIKGGHDPGMALLKWLRTFGEIDWNPNK
jgi:hypothetical protein